MKSIEELASKHIPPNYELRPYRFTLAELQAFAEAYHKQKLAELEPVAWCVYVEVNSDQYYVDSLDDLQLEDDATNHNAEITPLYTLPSKG